VKKKSVLLSFSMIFLWLLSSCGKMPAKTVIPDSTPTPAATNTLTPTSTITLVPTPTAQIGSTLVRETDGMTMVYVPEGEFTMGTTEMDPLDNPAHTIYLDAFWIDRTEVTNAQYAKCVTAGVCTHTEVSSKTRVSYYDDPNYVDFPVIYVNWFDAQKYCEWAGAALPSEAQWEKAALGTDGRIHPWGDGSPGCSKENFWPGGNSPLCVGDTDVVGHTPDGASPYGALDMAGNVREWVNDWYSETYYAESPINNPTGPESGQSRVVRDTPWSGIETRFGSTFRAAYPPTESNPYFGFRCAISLPFTRMNPTPTPTITPTIGPTFISPSGKVFTLPVINGTEFPQTNSIISSDNAANLIKLANYHFPEIVGGIQNIDFTPSNNIAMVSTSDRMIRILDFDGNVQKSFGPLSDPHNGISYKVFMVSKDGTHLVVAETYYTPPVMYYPNHWHTAIYIQNLQDESDQQNSILSAGIPAFSEDLSTLALLHDWAGDQKVQLWTFKGISHNEVLSIAAGGKENVVISADGSMIATDYVDSAILWQTKDGSRIMNLTGAGIPIAFSEDGRYLATLNASCIEIWNIADKKLIQSLPFNGYLNKVVFSPNSEILAMVVNTDVLIWNVSDGSLLKTLVGDKDTNIYTNSVVFSPDGKFIAYDRFQTIVIWGIP
jgi:formylglycine-generating enzyme required for sulfatase activity/WD40 repeat protein